MSEQIYDVIVVGGGAIGLGATYEVAKSGASVLVLEQNYFYNQAGSSGDLARMYRTMYTEDFMADIAKDSLKIWTELEEDAGTSLRTMTGLLNFGDPNVGSDGPEGTLLGPIPNLKRLDMRYEELDKDQIEARWPFRNLPSNWKGVFAPDNGVINIPLMLRTLSRLAKDYGAHARHHVEVKRLVPEKHDGKKIWKVEAFQQGKGDVKFRCRKVIVTTGAYTNHVLKPSFDLELKLDIWEMTASYFSVNAGPGGTVFPSMWFQFANPVKEGDKDKSQFFYGFPTLDWGSPNLCRIAVDDATLRIKDPDQRSASVVSPDDVANVQEFIENHIPGVDSTVPASSLVCLMTNVFDNMFVLDYVPEQYLKGGEKDSVVVFTAGWAMKFVPLLGRALKEMALNGGSPFALDEFKIDRKDKKTGKPGIIQDPSEVHLTANIASLSFDGGEKGGSSIHRPHLATL